MHPKVVAQLPEARVRISSADLVRLSRFGRAMQLRPGRVLARHGGDYQSPFKGRGMEFDESRLYQPGDDTRSIDWRVTARTGKTHTKVFREERERPILVWLDLRRPMFFATHGAYKAVVAARCAGLVAWGGVQHGDRIGGLVFSETAHHEIKPRRGKSGVLRLIEKIVGHPAWQGRGAGADGITGNAALVRLEHVVRPGSLVCLISDFRGLDDAAWSRISRLSRHNELLLAHIYDRFEAELPTGGRYRISNGAEELVIDAGDRGQSENHARRFRQHLQKLQQTASRDRIRLVHCSTEDDPVTLFTTALPAMIRI
jgi:uncharacterized protein (DUF58 family)